MLVFFFFSFIFFPLHSMLVLLSFWLFRRVHIYKLLYIYDTRVSAREKKKYVRETLLLTFTFIIIIFWVLNPFFPSAAHHVRHLYALPSFLFSHFTQLHLLFFFFPILFSMCTRHNCCSSWRNLFFSSFNFYFIIFKKQEATERRQISWLSLSWC